MNIGGFPKHQGVAAAAVCIVAAILCRNIGREIPGRWLGLLRAVLYIGLFMGWGLSVRRRVTQRQTRSLLSAVAALAVFWIAVRTVKYFFVTAPAAVRYLWYLYYLPMLAIPLLSLFVSISLGQPEGYRLPRLAAIPAAVSAALVVLVLTNDLHQCVFCFGTSPSGLSGDRYSYGAGYYAAVAWMIVCALSAVGIMAYKCRAARGRKTVWLPLGCIFAAAVYGVLYVLFIGDHTSLLYYLAGDVTVALCVIFIGTLESCLQTGLIASNTGYGALFAASSIGMRITDTAYVSHYASAAALPLSTEDMRRAEAGGMLYENEALLREYPIRGGHVFWQEDVSALLRVRRELETARAELDERGALLREQYRQDAARCRTQERSRLYDLVRQDTQKQLAEIGMLRERFSRAQEPAERAALLSRILVLATYVKRHKNMVVASDRMRTAPLQLLGDALRESCGELSRAGAEGNIFLPDPAAEIPIRAALAAYELFEEAAERALGTLRYYYVTVAENDGALRLSVEFDCAAELMPLLRKTSGAAWERDGGSWFFSLPLNGEATE